MEKLYTFCKNGKCRKVTYKEMQAFLSPVEIFKLLTKKETSIKGWTIV